MTIQKTECYTISCDVCGEPLEHDWIPHFESVAEAQEGAQEDDWYVWKDKAWHDWCNQPCTCGHLFGDHNYGETGCEAIGQDCGCSEYAWP